MLMLMLLLMLLLHYANAACKTCNHVNEQNEHVSKNELILLDGINFVHDFITRVSKFDLKRVLQTKCAVEKF